MTLVDICNSCIIRFSWYVHPNLEYFDKVAGGPWPWAKCPSCLPSLSASLKIMRALNPTGYMHVNLNNISWGHVYTFNQPDSCKHLFFLWLFACVTCCYIKLHYQTLLQFFIIVAQLRIQLLVFLIFLQLCLFDLCVSFKLSCTLVINWGISKES